jgi:hypothetical protein
VANDQALTISAGDIVGSPHEAKLGQVEYKFHRPTLHTFDAMAAAMKEHPSAAEHERRHAKVGELAGPLLLWVCMRPSAPGITLKAVQELIANHASELPFLIAREQLAEFYKYDSSFIMEAMRLAQPPWCFPAAAVSAMTLFQIKHIYLDPYDRKHSPAT